MVVYVASDVLALKFTSQSIISSCGGMAIVWNNLLAPITLGERFTRAQLSACCFILLGTIGESPAPRTIEHAHCVTDCLASVVFRHSFDLKRHLSKSAHNSAANRT